MFNRISPNVSQNQQVMSSLDELLSTIHSGNTEEIVNHLDSDPILIEQMRVNRAKFLKVVLRQCQNALDVGDAFLLCTARKVVCEELPERELEKIISALAHHKLRINPRVRWNNPTEKKGDFWDFAIEHGLFKVIRKFLYHIVWEPGFNPPKKITEKIIYHGLKKILGFYQNDPRLQEKEKEVKEHIANVISAFWSYEGAYHYQKYYPDVSKFYKTLLDEIKESDLKDFGPTLMEWTLSVYDNFDFFPGF